MASILFALAGLLFVLAGQISIGMMFVCLSVLYGFIGRRR